MPALALFQPDIPQNTGALMRLSACLGFALHIIGPTGFAMTDKALRRSGLDYSDRAATVMHTNWHAFEERIGEARLLLATAHGATPHTAFRFKANDIVLTGRESAGAPDWLHERADARIVIPMKPNNRSLNMALAAAILMGEAMRQTETFPPMTSE